MDLRKKCEDVVAKIQQTKKPRAVFKVDDNKILDCKVSPVLIRVFKDMLSDESYVGNYGINATVDSLISDVKSHTISKPVKW